MAKTRQEIFDAAWNGLKSQGFEQSVAENGDCLFRSRNGRKCAIGWCIPDDKYNSKMDQDGEWWDRAFKAAGITDDTRSFAEELQAVHDWQETPSDMEQELRHIAAKHSLTIPGENA